VDHLSSEPAVLTYLDHGATTPLRPEVAEAMAEVTSEPLGNPTGSHRPAQRARRLLEEARDEVAALMDRDPGQIIFTSGGTESANLAVFGTLAGLHRDGSTAAIVCSAVEHPAVLESCRAAALEGAVRLNEVPVDSAGVIALNALTDLVDVDTQLVAIMLANNETGVMQPLADVVEAVRRKNDATRIFTDAVQAASFVDLAEQTRGCDLVALSAHKLGGPVGVGVLAEWMPSGIAARQYGGGQERERRSGTQNVVGAVGMATALRFAAAEREDAAERVAGLRDALAEGLCAAIPDAVRTIAPGVATLAGHLHLCIPGVEREELLVLMGERGICASGGSSCASGALQTSHVLAAMGVADGLSRGAIRFTLGHATTPGDVERAVTLVPGLVDQIRQGS
jgi:cysteine desulfurase